MVSMALGILCVLVPLQMLLGDQHGLNTLRHQPTKLAAIEGRWETRSHAPLTVFALPDMQGEQNRYAIEIPELGSLILTHHADGVVPGLKDVAREERPPMAIPFFAFRIMVGIGCLMLAIVVIGGYLRLRGRIIQATWYLRCCEFASCLGFFAVLAGWITTEVGRQPWTVYGLLRTRDAVSPSLTGGDVALSLLGYSVVYLIVYTVGFGHILRLMRQGPTREATGAPVPLGVGRPPIGVLPTQAIGSER